MVITLYMMSKKVRKTEISRSIDLRQGRAMREEGDQGVKRLDPRPVFFRDAILK